MRHILIMVVLLAFFISGCAGGVGVTSIALPDVQAFEYKDILACAKVEAAPGFSDCKIKLGDSGGSITVRIQTNQIPQEPISEPAPVSP